MMSLISQNVLLKKPMEKLKDREVSDPVVLEGSGEPVVGDESGLVVPKNKKRKKCKQDEAQIEEEEKEMKMHESFLFGSLYSSAKFGEEEEQSNSFGGGHGLFFTDRSAGVVEAYEEEAEYEDGSIKKPAWVDDEGEGAPINIAKVNRLRKLRTEEDESLVAREDYESRLRAQYVKMNHGTEWAQLGSDKDDQRHESILLTDEDIVVKGGVKLLPGHLEYSRLVDANAEDPSNDPISSVQFHRNAQLLLAAGLDKRLRFFQIDGKRNNMIQSISFKDCPIRKASFLQDGSQVIVGGRRKFFYTVDFIKATYDRIGPLVGRDEKSLESFEVSPDSRTIAFLGNGGHILLVSCKTKELIGTLKMNGSARSLAFNDDGTKLLSSGGDGHIYHWDLRTRTCFHKAVDEGCLSGSALATSPNGALFAAGSSSGVVNVYNHEEFLGGKRKPLKAIENLTTKVDFLKFNHDAQILAICSTMQRSSSLKLVHLPSFSVFSNCLPLERSRCLDFSPGGGFMAMGNAGGNVYLYKLHHYQRA